MKRVIGFLILCVVSMSSWAGIFKNHINEIQVYQDRVRVHIGSGYGTCGAKEGWFGWYTSNERHQDWLSLALTAKASNAPISMYDQADSCNGPVDAVGVEGVFLPKAE